MKIIGDITFVKSETSDKSIKTFIDTMTEKSMYFKHIMFQRVSGFGTCVFYLETWKDAVDCEKLLSDTFALLPNSTYTVTTSGGVTVFVYKASHWEKHVIVSEGDEKDEDYTSD